MIELLELVAHDLADLQNATMYFGAAILSLYLDDPGVASVELRPTEDVDIVVSVAAQRSGAGSPRALEKRLIELGFAHDLRRHRKNIHAFISPSGVAVDVVMDTLYDPSDWPLKARASARPFALPNGRGIQIPSLAYYLACKVSASKEPRRWEGAYYSHDLEDIALVLAGCSGLVAGIKEADTDVRAFLASWASELRSQETDFGKNSYTVLATNLPRSFEIDKLDVLLKDIASVGAS